MSVSQRLSKFLFTSLCSTGIRRIRPVSSNSRATIILRSGCSSQNSGSNRLLCTVAKEQLAKAWVTVTFIMPDGEKYTVQGACEGTLACSTCHLVLNKEDFEKLPEKPSDEELDMLDLAYGLCDTSRLGCQIILNKKLNGLIVKVPSAVSDARGQS